MVGFHLEKLYIVHTTRLSVCAAPHDMCSHLCRPKQPMLRPRLATMQALSRPPISERWVDAH